MDSNFDILINGALAPNVVKIPATFGQGQQVVLKSHAGSAAKGTIVAIDTDGALIPLDTLGGMLDANGQFKFIVGPSAGVSSALRGSFALNISVGSKKATQNFQFV